MDSGVNCLKLVEMFKSIEGEGLRSGYVCTFIRTFGCPCRCVYCDSMYANETGHGVDIRDMTVDEIVQYCKDNKTPYVTLTGGEPLVQPDMAELIKKLLQNGFKVNVETSGAVDISKFKQLVYDTDAEFNNLIFTVDYKSLSSGCNDMMIENNFMDNIDFWDVVKFVVGNKEDLDDMKLLLTNMREFHGADMPHVFVSPIFGMIEPKEIVEYLKDNDLFDVRMQLQIHKFIWDFNQRGV